MPDLSVSGTTPGQAVSDAATIGPFSTVSLASTASTTPETTATVTLSTTADGALSHLGIGGLSADGSTYTVSGSAADVQSALRGLVFTPVAHQAPVGQSVTTGFALAVSDAAGAVTDTRTTVITTAADTLPTITDTSTTQAPSNAVTRAGPTPSSPLGFAPFLYTTITDPDAGAVETTGITLTQNGVATDAVGVLSGSGLTKTGVGTYTLAAATPAAETAALEALAFTPANLGTAAALAVALGVSDGVGAPVTAALSLGLVGNPGGSTVVTNSVQALTTYSDTPASTAAHTYATTIDGVLSGGAVVYDQTFDLPYSDPQVQAAVAQAEAAVQAAGATAGTPMQTASNLTTLSSQTTTAETGRSTAASGTTTTTAFGPGLVGPNVDVPGAGNSEADRGFFYILPGQIDINVNQATTTMVDRTVTTTSTDLLSQQYVVSGTSTAMPASTTTLVSSSAAGVEGNALSQTIFVTNGVTGDGGSVLFISQATNLSPGDNNPGDLYLKNASTGAITLVDVSSTGVSSNSSVDSGAVNETGNLVAFSTRATNLDPGATDGTEHLYLRDISASTLTLVSPADYTFKDATTGVAEASAQFQNLMTPSVSGNGRYISVECNDTGGGTSVLLLDTLTHTGVVLSKGGSSSSAVSEDGSTVVFNSPLNNHNEIYAYSVVTDSLQLLSDTQGANAPSVVANGNSGGASVSNDGSRVVFGSTANNLDSRATGNGIDHVYVKDVTTGQLFLVDTAADGAVGNQSARDGGVSGVDASISGDGTMVAFTSTATNLVPGVVDGGIHIYIKNLTTGAVSLLDQSGAAPGNGGSQYPLFSSDSAHVAFSSSASNLVANDTNNTQDVFLTSLSATATPPANTPPTISGTVTGQPDPAGTPIHLFSTVVVADPDAGQTETVTVFTYTPDRGPLAGGGFAQTAPGTYVVTGTAAQVTADLQAATFTPVAGQNATTVFTVSANDGQAMVGDSRTSVVATPALPANTPPTFAGAMAGQADVAGVAISPFSTVTVTDPDAGQTETVTVSLSAAANGTLAGGGFVQTAPGVYSVAAASAAAAQADLRAAVFTPTAGQSATTGFTLTVSDGQATATDPTTSVVATYTPPPPPPPASGGGGAVTTTSSSVQDGLATEFQNLERALAGGADALTPTTPVYAAFQAEKLVAAQLDAGQVTLAQAEATLAHLVDGTTAVAVASYGFFTGATPAAQGLDYLVHSQANATDLNDAYYARFSTENRYINFAVNLATGPGAGASAFQASYGSLSLADATAKAYAAVFGAPADATKVSALLDTLVPDGLGGQETRAQYFAQYGGDGPNGEGTKAAMVGFLLANAVETGAGVYGAATEHYLSALAHGQAPAFGSELALTYGANVNLVGFTPVPDPTVTT